MKQTWCASHAALFRCDEALSNYILNAINATLVGVAETSLRWHPNRSAGGVLICHGGVLVTKMNASFTVSERSTSETIRVPSTTVLLRVCTPIFFAGDLHKVTSKVERRHTTKLRDEVPTIPAP